MKPERFFFVVVFVVALSTWAQADLVLVLNTSNQTFALQGTDTANPANISVGGTSNGGRITWLLGNISGSASGQSTTLDTQGSLFSSETLTGAPLGTGTISATPSSPISDVEIVASQGTSGTTRIEFTLNVQTLGDQIITGNQTFHSYAGLGSRASIFEAAIGSALTTSRQPQNDINVVAIPEPSSSVILATLLLGMARVRRRVA